MWKKALRYELFSCMGLGEMKGNKERVVHPDMNGKLAYSLRPKPVSTNVVVLGHQVSVEH